jgi:ABC-2 type transport system ATP-binding protein
VIEIQALSKHYGSKVALDALSMTVNGGEVMGFLGPNGSGKTTTIRLLMGLLRPSRGQARILSKDCHTDSVSLKRDVGYLPDEPFLYPYLSGLEFLELVAGLHGFSGTEARRRAHELAERFVGPEAARFCMTYSHGTKKRVAFAAALIHDPKVLILDEPTNGLDPMAAKQMKELVAQLAREGKTVFLSTHLLETAERLCHRVAIVSSGRLLAIDEPANLQRLHGGEGGGSLEDAFVNLLSSANT